MLYAPTPCSVGVMVLPNLLIHTIERPLIIEPAFPSGVPFRSCIPYGKYEIIPHASSKFKKTWALVNPKLGVYQYRDDRVNEYDRYACLIHVANWAKEVSGCIGPGIGASRDNESEHLVTKSVAAIGYMESVISNSGTYLDIMPFESPL